MYNYNDYVYIFHSKNGEYNITHFTKTKKGWQVEGKLYNQQNIIKHYNSYTIFINTIEKYKSTFICVAYPEVFSAKIIVNDSLGSQFDFTEMKLDMVWKDYIYCAVVNDNNVLNDEYIMLINGQEYKPLK